MAAAVARAAEVPEADVRRALTLSGDLAETAAIALSEGREGLAAVRLQVGRPLSPMLAATAPDVGAALERTGPAAVEFKLDGARVQIHRDGDDVAVFTRTLDDVTAHVPEAVEAALALPARTAVLDGEVIALRADGRPHPFQVTGLALRRPPRPRAPAPRDPAQRVLLRPAAPRRRRPARRAAVGARRGARRARPRPPDPARGRRRRRARPRRSSTPRSPPATRA